jgi:uncharacterized protein YqeY
MTQVTLTQQLQDDMKTAMRAKAADRLVVIREILSNIKKKLIDAPPTDATNRTDLSDTDVLAIIEKMVKQRRDSITQFIQGERPELAAKEQAELEMLQHYLPTQLTADEITDYIKAAIDETKATGIKDMGKVMNLIRPKVQGRVEMAVVSQKIKELLA